MCNFEIELLCTLLFYYHFIKTFETDEFITAFVDCPVIFIAYKMFRESDPFKIKKVICWGRLG